MPTIHRSGRNRGAYNRRGRNDLGLCSMEQALLAMANAQASLGMTDSLLESNAGIPRGSIRRLRLGQGLMGHLAKITDYFELRLVG